MVTIIVYVYDVILSLKIPDFISNMKIHNFSVLGCDTTKHLINSWNNRNDKLLSHWTCSALGICVVSEAKRGILWSTLENNQLDHSKTKQYFSM